jgi:hypothetical protein
VQCKGPLSARIALHVDVRHQETHPEFPRDTLCRPRVAFWAGRLHFVFHSRHVNKSVVRQRSNDPGWPRRHGNIDILSDLDESHRALPNTVHRPMRVRGLTHRVRYLSSSLGPRSCLYSTLATLHPSCRLPSVNFHRNPDFFAPFYRLLGSARSSRCNSYIFCFRCKRVFFCHRFSTLRACPLMAKRGSDCHYRGNF